MIFVDTGAWFAALVPDDSCHIAAADFLRSNDELLLTTDYVLDELLTLLKARGHLAGVEVFVQQLLEGSGEMARLEWTTMDDFIHAWLLFQRHRDKAWSFTDCVGFSVINRLGIKKAFAFDDHFRQFGGASVVP